ncbi:MAG: phosphoribosyltransferase [Gammaproteobacteria bacterium]|nr:phosphoribosyltransferase [Gammaproteobacteria bacterium]
MTVFADRRTAGIRLAERLAARRLPEPQIVLGLPRGGVPVAAEVARRLGAPLDVIVVRKVGMPGQEEFAIGAIAFGGIVVREPGVEHYLDGLPVSFETLVVRQQQELERRERAYRSGRPPAELAGRTAVLVDDGLATGTTMLAAVRAARQGGAARIIAAAPVGTSEARERVEREADEVILLAEPPGFMAVGQFYLRFEQVADEEVIRLLE